MARTPSLGLAPPLILLVLAGCGGPLVGSSNPPGSPTGSLDGTVGLPAGPPTREQVLRGRQLVLTRDCGACHGGPSPAHGGWLAGRPAEDAAYVVGPYRAWARNLTADPSTGLGRFSERQIFNALRFGLRPSATSDVEITSTTPGEGNHPARPEYLSPAMPWASWRHMSDQELWAIIAYLKHAITPVHNQVPDGETPPDGWASWFTVEQIGPHPLAPFPTDSEELRAGAHPEQVLQGRRLAASMGCGECHGGRGNPAADGWLAGAMSSEHRPQAAPFEQELRVGPFMTYPRNLTPHNTMGLGRFSERQIFNALRFGLRPGETADVEITSATPGVGGYPLHPKYLPPSMPWTAWRHLSDEELWAIAAYLKHGLKPVANRVPDSGGPPDFWVSLFTAENFGSYPAAPYPAAAERDLP